MSPSAAQAPSQPVWRIRDRQTFARLRARGRRVRNGPITVSWLPGDPARPPQVAYAIGRPVGNAVQRNRLRRRLRAIVSDRSAGLRSGAYLIGVAPEAAALPWGDLRTTVTEALDAASHDGQAASPRGDR